MWIQYTCVYLHKNSSDMEIDNRYIRFDWAVKRLLRDKANFAVLEGFVTVLLNEPIQIVEILESEGNQETEDDKFNRVDIKAKDSRGDIIIVEVQLSRELHYLERILYGTAKAITEHIKLGSRYDQVKKVYSISIIYFDMGKGSDYVYHGQTVFTWYRRISFLICVPGMVLFVGILLLAERTRNHKRRADILDKKAGDFNDKNEAELDSLQSGIADMCDFSDRVHCPGTGGTPVSSGTGSGCEG